MSVEEFQFHIAAEQGRFLRASDFCHVRQSWAPPNICGLPPFNVVAKLFLDCIQLTERDGAIVI